MQGAISLLLALAVAAASAKVYFQEDFSGGKRFYLYILR